jgi:hypothetical protein
LGLFAATPLSAIPPTAAIIGFVIAALAVQMLFGRRHPWLPQAICRRSVSAKKLAAAREKLAPTLAFFDRFVERRLAFAAGGPMRRIAAAIVLLLALSFIPFEFVPFAGAAPASAVVLFGVAITVRDGFAMLLGIAGFAGVIALGLVLLT